MSEQAGCPRVAVVASRCVRRAQPTAELQRYFDAAGADVGAGVMAQLDALAAAVFPPAPPPPGPAFMQTSVALEHRREVRRPGARARTQGRPPPDPGARPVRLSPAAMPRHDTAVAHDDAPPWGPVPISTAGPSSGGFPVCARPARPVFLRRCERAVSCAEGTLCCNTFQNTLHSTLIRVTDPPRQGTALYLRVLEALLRAEEARTGRAAFPALLGSASFHTCLLALAFELVAASYCMARPAAPPARAMCAAPADWSSWRCQRSTRACW